jgi:hypothetical protein
MKKYTGFFFAILLVAMACEKDDSPSDTFSNSLTLGTGLNPSNLFELTGEGTSFPAGSLVYFRLESKDDMAGSPVRLNFKSGGTDISNIDYPSLQEYGHIYLSSFTAPVAGNYTATGILTEGNKTIASINFRSQ